MYIIYRTKRYKTSTCSEMTRCDNGINETNQDIIQLITK